MKDRESKVYGALLLALSAVWVLEAPFVVFQCEWIRRTFLESGDRLTPYGCFFYLDLNDGRAVCWVLAFVAIGVAGIFWSKHLLYGAEQQSRRFE